MSSAGGSKPPVLEESLELTPKCPESLVTADRAEHVLRAVARKQRAQRFVGSNHLRELPETKRRDHRGHARERAQQPVVKRLTVACRFQGVLRAGHSRSSTPASASEAFFQR